jgi:hypothetical protein
MTPRIKYHEAVNRLSEYGWSTQDPWYPRPSKNKLGISEVRLADGYSILPRQGFNLIIHVATNMAVPRHEAQFVADQREFNRPKYHEAA